MANIPPPTDGPTTPFSKPLDLTEWRERFGYSQRQAAEAIGCSRGAWTGYEHGDQPIPKYISLAIAALSLGVGR
ncbi:transcriptional regulator with XRE-family HTH domain [Bradyrhizobium japonicum]|uniref:helix-turn-helix domain-containing protein n=1 Tax=Bradyrhizobium japonicum TaxID=375 RepID=UPI0020103AAC|nr:helix-turn-helix transcriptional regulator [Bradyrhizobium japonicum]UQE01151.1 helix-turn-helix domain-containing protein [Bradyrhizobium japonicum]